MSLTPAHDAVEARRIKEERELCGKNRAPHDFIAIEWVNTKMPSGVDVYEKEVNRITKLMCRVCFKHIEMSLLIQHYPEIKE